MDIFCIKLESRKLRQGEYNYMIRNSGKDTWPTVMDEQQPDQICGIQEHPLESQKNSWVSYHGIE